MRDLLLLGKLFSEKRLSRNPVELSKTAGHTLLSVLYNKYSIRKNDIRENGNKSKKPIPATPSLEGNLFGQKTENEKEGIKIDFSTLQVEAKDKRSAYGDGVITIFANHPDFINRRGSNELEQTRITPRLSTYLAAVISSEYKAVFYQQKKLEPQLNSKKILEEQIDFIFRFEQKMKDLVNLPIDSIGSIS